MPSAYGRAKEKLCLGGCGRTVRETVDDCGTCRKCLTAKNPNDTRLTMKRVPDSYVNPIALRSQRERMAGVSTAEEELLAAVDAAGMMLNPPAHAPQPRQRKKQPSAVELASLESLFLDPPEQPTPAELFHKANDAALAELFPEPVTMPPAETALERLARKRAEDTALLTASPAMESIERKPPRKRPAARRPMIEEKLDN